MDPRFEALARSVARTFGPAVEMRMEEAIATGGAGEGRRQFADPATALSLVGLILNVVPIAWEIAKVILDGGRQPSAADIERRVFDRLEREGRLRSAADEEAVIRRTVQAVLDAQRGDGAGPRA